MAQRAIDWEFAMQCRNGGWGSFDKDNTKMIFQYIPFADHNAMLDPPTVDITGRILEMLATYGYTREDKRVKKAIEFILSEQESDGSWFGRWGVNYLYGTFLVLRGLEAIGFDQHEPQVQQAAEWIRMVQNPDGGWGETCGSYDDPNHARHLAPARLRRRRGRCSACLPPATTVPIRSPRAFAGCLNIRKRTAAGMNPSAPALRARRSTPAPDFPASSILRITVTATTSRCLLSPRTSGRWSGPRSEGNARQSARVAM